ncbi:MAG TPA: transcriptional regulator, partial [Blastocatellia bacterium]|nr:transcriptional regulator [Blastocatellia bacterium]
MAVVTRNASEVYEFGSFRLDPVERLLLVDGAPVPLAPKVFDTLLVLVEASGRLVTKDDLMSRLWPDTFVEEGTLTRNISDLRKALADAGDGDQYIQTVPRHGYRFSEPVRLTTKEPAVRLDDTHRSSEGPAEGETSDEPAPRMEIAGRHSRSLVIKISIAVSLAGAIVAGTLMYRYLDRPKVTSVSDVHSIAVLPFTTIGNDARDEYL